MSFHSFQVKYDGSYIILILWMLIYFPVSLVLLMTGGMLTLNNKAYKLKYGGSRLWLCFWVIVLFPIAFLLIFLNGFTIIEMKTVETIEINSK